MYSHTDILTTDNILLDQAALLQQLLNHWQQALADDFSVSIFIINVDKFSLLDNKSACFDRILAAIRQQFQRETDFIARFNRKQIIAISSHMSFRQSSQLADRLHRAVKELEVFHPHSPNGRYATISIGHATYSPATENSYGVLDLLATVIKHVRLAKKAGGNCSKTRLHSRLLT